MGAFDKAFKDWVDRDVPAWAASLARCIGLQMGPVEELTPDLSRTSQADRAFLVRGESPGALHLEVYSRVPPGTPLKLSCYNRDIAIRAGCTVYTIVVVLRPEGYHNELDRRYSEWGPRGRAEPDWLQFRYHVLRVWESNEVRADPPAYAAWLQEHVLRAYSGTEDQRLFIETASVLAGVRYSPREVLAMMGNWEAVLMDSSLIQEAIAKGEAIGIVRGEARGEARGQAIGRIGALREAVLDFLRGRFGTVPAEVEESIGSLED